MYVSIMNLSEAQQWIFEQIQARYPASEARNMADWLMEAITEWKKLDRIVHANQALTVAQEEQLHAYVDELLAGRPIQYVLGEAWFYGYRFFVNEHVLIPRPETEELVDWIYSDLEQDNRLQMAGSLLDVGTGSGCIPISLQKLLPTWQVMSIDLSREAMQMAQKNAAFLDAPVAFRQLDFLDPAQRDQLAPVDILVSNPPYIPRSESASMAAHVVAYEPALALFVPDEDALVFYRALADWGKDGVRTGGAIYMEIHESLAKATIELFRAVGYTDMQLKQDMQGKDRMLRVAATTKGI
jgi:release factor glutamine methyltransferase